VPSLAEPVFRLGGRQWEFSHPQRYLGGREFAPKLRSGCIHPTSPGVMRLGVRVGERERFDLALPCDRATKHLTNWRSALARGLCAVSGADGLNQFIVVSDGTCEAAAGVNDLRSRATICSGTPQLGTTN
jgi:hypothetical protein